mmetsp:Transcript_12159/g.25598  ORF Transcript_12159/g.25598 Transcript_12159/m.25598 type:complete len:107 (+) Transcript_12159:492-812(+)
MRQRPKRLLGRSRHWSHTEEVEGAAPLRTLPVNEYPDCRKQARNERYERHHNRRHNSGSVLSTAPDDLKQYHYNETDNKGYPPDPRNQKGKNRQNLGSNDTCIAVG